MLIAAHSASLAAQRRPWSTGARCVATAPSTAWAPCAVAPARLPARRCVRVFAGKDRPGFPPAMVEPGPERLEWPFPGFVARTIAKFPDAGVCHVEEARVLEEEDGYTFLDVRTKQEYEYRIAGSINVPIIHATWRFEKGRPAKVPDPQAANLDFVKQVEAKFPDKATKLIITCSDGRTRTLSALRALDAAGYTHLVGMKNGYNHWSRIFDNKFWRRVEPDAMREVDAADFPDQSTGIFGTGASYDRTDSVQWTPIRDTNTWLDWQEETSKA